MEKYRVYLSRHVRYRRWLERHHFFTRARTDRSLGAQRFTYADAAQFSLPPIELVGMLVPGFFGRGPADAWGPWARVEVGYLGIFPLPPRRVCIVLRRNSKTMFFVLVSIIGLLLALGGYAILHGWLFQFVPGFGQLRAPARFILLLDFGSGGSSRHRL